MLTQSLKSVVLLGSVLGLSIWGGIHNASSAPIHDPLCRSIKPGQTQSAEDCLKSYANSKGKPEKRMVRVSAEPEAFEALEEILTEFGEREAQLEELNYADYVGVTRTTGAEGRLTYYIIHAGEFVTPKQVLDINLKDLPLFFGSMSSQGDIFHLHTEKFELNF